MSTKKFGIVAGIALALSVVVAAPASAACSLATLSECDNTGLMALIVQLLGGQQTTQTTGTTISGIPAGFQFTTNLKQGSTGNDVKYLQILLNSDTATSIGNAGKETTYFGAMTKAAVVKFQNKYASEVLTPYGLSAGTGFFGSASRTKANALIGAGVGTGTGTGTGTTTPATGAYTVSLAANQPTGTLGEGSAYNPVLKVSVSAGATAQTITSVTVQRTGLSIDTNVAGVLVADENGVRHGNIVTFASNSATISFANDPITVAAGATKVISIQLNMQPDPTNVTTFSGTMGVNVTAMSGTPAGLPLVGNTFTLVDTNSTMGTLSTDVVSLTQATVSKDIGTTGYEIQKFKLTAGANEDVYLKKLTMYQNGTVSDADITNIKLVAPDGTVLSTVASATNKYVTFDLTAAPYKIAKGTSKDLSVRIDVGNGSSRTAQFIIQNDYDVVATGASTGLNILPTGGASVDTSFPIGDRTNGLTGYNHMTIAAGSLYVSKSTTSPSGVISIGSSNVTIATYNFEARGEDIELRRVDVSLTGTGLAAADLAGTVKLVTEDGTTIMSLATTATGLVGGTAGTNLDTLSTYYTIPAGTTKKISIVVDTASGMGATDTIQGELSDIYYKQVTTNSYATYSAETYLMGNELSASSGTLTVVKNGSLGDSSKVAGSTDVKIGSYLLQTGSTEGVNVSSIAIYMNGTDEANTDSHFSNLRLKKSDGTLLGTAITSPVIDAYTTANTFTVSGQLNIPASTTVQVDVYVNMDSTASNGDGTADILTTEIKASGVSATGATSGAPANGPSATQVGQNISIVAGGTLTVAMETSGAASAQFLTTGLSGVELAKIKLAATVENMKIERLEVRSINGSGNIAQMKLLGTGLSSDPIAAVTGGTAVFTFASGSEITVPAYGSKVLTVAADTTNVGTITAGQLGTVGFGTMNARGEGSGNTVQESVTGAIKVAGTDAFDGSAGESTTGVVGDVIYFTKAATDGTGGGTAANTAPGYYMVTAIGNVDLTTAAGSLTLNGDADDVKWTAGDKVIILNKVFADDGDVDVMDGALAVGDIVYFHDISDTTNDGFYAITKAVAAGATAVGDTTTSAIYGKTIAAEDYITKLTNVNALVGNTMQFEEVEPVIAVASSSPSGTGHSATEEVVGVFDVKAEGSRDLAFTSFAIEKGGNNSPEQYVTHFSLWNGSTKISEVATTTISGATGVGETNGDATVKFVSAAGGGAGTLAVGDDGVIMAKKLTKGDRVTLRNVTDSSSVSLTVSSNDGAAEPTVTFTTTATLAASKSYEVRNFTVRFDAGTTATGDTQLVSQTITSGQTMTLTVKADTTAVKTGTTNSVTFYVSVPGTAGPLTTNTGGLTWSYTKLNPNGTAHTGTTADGYPVNGNSLSY